MKKIILSAATVLLLAGSAIAINSNNSSNNSSNKSSCECTCCEDSCTKSCCSENGSCNK